MRILPDWAGVRIIPDQTGVRILSDKAGVRITPGKAGVMIPPDKAGVRISLDGTWTEQEGGCSVQDRSQDTLRYERSGETPLCCGAGAGAKTFGQIWIWSPAPSSGSK